MWFSLALMSWPENCEYAPGADWKPGHQPPTTTHTTMLQYAIIFLVVAVIAAILGFGTLAGVAATIAKICFVVFLVLALLAFFRKAT